MLTRYFYNSLVKFEQPIGFRDAYSDMLDPIDVAAKLKEKGKWSLFGLSSGSCLHSATRIGTAADHGRKAAGGGRSGKGPEVGPTGAGQED